MALLTKEHKEEVVLAVSEQRSEYFEESDWVKNPKDWYERTQRRGPFYGQKRWSSDTRCSRSDDEDETDETYRGKEVDEAPKRIYDLRKIPVKKEYADKMEQGYQLFHESSDDEETEDENRNGILRKRSLGETASEKNDVFVRSIFGEPDDVELAHVWKSEQNGDVTYSEDV
jgi:hypothetical protein